MHRIRVAIADDDQLVRLALADLVRSHAHLELVDLVANGRDAVESARRHRPDVMLMDVRMPGLDGIEATRRIRGGGLRVRIVALSAYQDRETVLAMLRAGAVGYLVKGCTAAELLQAVQRAALGQSALSPVVSAEVVRELAGRLEHEERLAEERRARIASVKAAIERGRRVVFQPIVALASGRTVGVEALSRFDLSPAQSPNAWFDTAAEVGLRVELELAAVRSALEAATALPPDVRLWVNVGPDALLTERLHDALGAAGRGCVIELTEHARIDDYEALAGSLAPLREGGVGLAVDDAGAGFASLRHILQLDPDHVKLDRSLTRGLASDRARRALAKALISFASEIGANVVAEGVEDAEEVRALRAAGVRYAQGFHFAQPDDLHALRLDPPAAAVTG